MKKAVSLLLTFFLLVISLASCDGISDDASNIDYEAVCVWAGYSRDTDFAEYAVNKNKLGESGVLPMQRIDTLAALERFKVSFADDFSLNDGYDEAPSFAGATAAYDEAFFDDNTLFVIYLAASSGSFRYGVSGLDISDGCLTVSVTELNDPEAVTDDMAGWFLLVSLPEEELSDCTSFDAKTQKR